MNFSIKELNELLYSLGTTASKGMMVNKELNSSLIDKLYGELSRKLEFYDLNGYEEIDEPEFDSAGFSVEDRYPHFVSNEEADEDARDYSAFQNYAATLKQDEQRYEDTFVSDSARTTSVDKKTNPKFRGEGTAQALLDYVDMKGAVSHKELHEYYKSLNGSNTFSWCLRNLTIPYKNRKTRRYLAKEGLRGSNAKYVVKIANPSNWVVVEDDIVTRICDFSKF